LIAQQVSGAEGISGLYCHGGTNSAAKVDSGNDAEGQK
jgi:hypothetical protein